MRGVYEEWVVLDHGPIESLADNVWHVRGALPPPLASGRRGMTVVRDEGGGLLLHNPVALGYEAMVQLEALGEVRTLVVPGPAHRLDSANFKRRYPDAQLLCPEGAREHVATVVQVDGTYEDHESTEAATLGYLEGLKPAEGMLEVRSSDGVTLVFNDILHNILERLPGVMGYLYGRFRIGVGKPNVHRGLGREWITDRARFKAQLERLAERADLRRVIVAHGHPAVLTEPVPYLRAVISTL